MENSGRPFGARTAAGAAGDTLVRAPRGTALSCKGWQQEAALRMLMNGLDPDVADRPEKLIASRDLGKVAADWEAFCATAEALRSLDNDEALLVNAGRFVRTFPTRGAPRVLIVDSDPAASWTYVGPQSFLPMAFEILAASSRKYFNGTLAGKLVVSGDSLGGVGGASPLATTMNGGAFLGIDHDAERIKRTVKAGYCDVMVNDLDEALRILKNSVRKREPASVGLAANPFETIPELASRGVVPDLLMLMAGAERGADDSIPHGMSPAEAARLRDTDAREFCRRTIESAGAVGEAARTLQKFGSIMFRSFPGNWQSAAPNGATPIWWVALSGEPSDIRRVDRLLLEAFADNENLRSWITAVQKRVRHQGLPARSCVLRPDERTKLGVAINELVARGEVTAPILIVRDRADLACATSALQNGDSLPGTFGAPPDADRVDSLLDLAGGASWASFQRSTGGAPRIVAEAVVADGTSEMSARIERVLSP